MTLKPCAWCGQLVDVVRVWCPHCCHNPKPGACECGVCTRGDMRPGRYYGVNPGGPLVPVDPGRPDRVICRRVVDYPRSLPPAASAIGACATCGVSIAFNPHGPHQNVPKVCMQCARIQPLSFTSGES